MYKVAIIEDDPLSLVALQDTLEKNFPEFEVIATYKSVQEATRNLSNQSIDLVLLDMELPDGRGFEVLSNLEEISFEVIITTLHDRFMLEAIKHSALDYLMKPITKQELEPALARFKKKVAGARQVKTDSIPKKSNRLVIPNQNGLVLLDINDIIRLESDGAYTKLFVADGKAHLVSKNLGFYEDSLIAHEFSRVHNKHLINLNHVTNYIRGEGGTIVMSDNSTVEVSRRKKEEFLKKLEM